MRARVAAAAVIALLPLSACSGGDDKPTDAIKVGTFSSLTGSASATFKAFPEGVKARIEQYKADKGKCTSRGFDIIEGDDASTSSGALAVAQKLVQDDKVTAVLQASSFFYGASDFLTSQAKGTPVFGGGFDGDPSYGNVKSNILSVLQPVDSKATFSQPGELLASKGVTKLALLGYDVPSAAKSLEQAQRSVEDAGIAVADFDEKIAFGTTDVSSIADAVEKSKANGLYMELDPQTALGVVRTLRDDDYFDNLKIVWMASGYGPGLLASQSAVEDAQGVEFSGFGWAPTELGGATIEQLSAALKKYGGNTTGVPGFAETMGWLTADLFLTALDKAGCDAASDQILTAARSLTSWDGNGLLNPARNLSTNDYDETCTYLLQLEDGAFEPDPDASPACGDKQAD